MLVIIADDLIITDDHIGEVTNSNKKLWMFYIWQSWFGWFKLLFSNWRTIKKKFNIITRNDH